MKKLLFFIVLVSVGCAGAKYTYTFEKGKSLDFGHGKWVLNKPHESGAELHMYDYATTYFKRILGDSLIRLDELRSFRIVPQQFSHTLNRMELKEIKETTKCDYLISIEEKNLKNEMTGFIGSTTIGRAIKTNESTLEIRIYDLTKLELLSLSSIIGVDKRTVDEDHNWGQATSAETIKRVGLGKLILAYEKNMVPRMNQ